MVEVYLLENLYKALMLWKYAWITLYEGHKIDYFWCGCYINCHVIYTGLLIKIRPWTTWLVILKRTAFNLSSGPAPLIRPSLKCFSR